VGEVGLGIRVVVDLPDNMIFVQEKKSEGEI
jgi:hypothetical protein